MRPWALTHRRLVGYARRARSGSRCDRAPETTLARAMHRGQGGPPVHLVDGCAAWIKDQRRRAIRPRMTGLQHDLTVGPDTA